MSPGQVHAAVPGFEAGTQMLVELYRADGQVDKAVECLKQTAEAKPGAMSSTDGKLSELYLLQLELLLEQGAEQEYLDGLLEPLLLELHGRLRDKPRQKHESKGQQRFCALGLATMGAEQVCQLVMNAARALCKLERGPEAVELIKTALGTDLWGGDRPELVHSLRLVLVELAWKSGELQEAYQAMCIYCLQQPYSMAAWCLYNQLAQQVGMWYKIHRPLIRALLKNPDSVPMTVLTGHHMSASGRLKLAVGAPPRSARLSQMAGLYFRAYRAMPDQPLISLCIGSSMLGLSMHKNAVQRHKVVMDAIGFLQRYAKLRQRPHEINYNYGRAYQQLGLFQLAIPCYKKVLAATDKDNTLQRHAAFNLSLIYSRSGSPSLAAQLLRTYVSV